MRKHINIFIVEPSKDKIKKLFKANKTIEDLDDEALAVLQVMIEKELAKRESIYAARGRHPNYDLV